MIISTIKTLYHLYRQIQYLNNSHEVNQLDISDKKMQELLDKSLNHAKELEKSPFFKTKNKTDTKNMLSYFISYPKFKKYYANQEFEQAFSIAFEQTKMLDKNTVTHLAFSVSSLEALNSLKENTHSEVYDKFIKPNEKEIISNVIWHIENNTQNQERKDGMRINFNGAYSALCYYYYLNHDIDKAKHYFFQEVSIYGEKKVNQIEQGTNRWFYANNPSSYQQCFTLMRETLSNKKENKKTMTASF